MQKLGASAAVVFGTVGDRLLSHSSFLPIWEKFASTGLPLCVHMGMSYTPFEQICQNLFETHGIGMSLPAQLAFVALVGDGVLDRFPSLKVAFLEFGAEWIFYMIGRLGHYLPIDRHDMPIKDSLPERSIEEYLASGRLFVAAEAEDRLLPHELMNDYKTSPISRSLVTAVLASGDLGRPFITPPGIAPEPLKILREAFRKTMSDTAFLAEVKARKLEPDPDFGEDLEAIAKDAVSQPKEIVERMKKLLSE